MPASLVVVCGALGTGVAYNPHTDRLPRRRWYDETRQRWAIAMPTPAHDAVSRLQQAVGSARCFLATTAPDGLLWKSGAEQALELRGSLFHLACVAHGAAHPRFPIGGDQDPGLRCRCGSELAPDVTDELRDTPALAEEIRQREVLVLVDVEPEWAQRLAGVARVEQRACLALTGAEAEVLVAGWLSED